MLFYTEEKDNVLIGIVGASYSSVTQPLATAALALNLPLISYAASRKGDNAYFWHHCLLK
jgi:hypothetical protein